MKKLNVNLGDRTYPIFIGSALLTQASLLAPYIIGNRVIIISSETIAPLYLATLKSTLAPNNYHVGEIILPDGEHYKTLGTLNIIYTQLLAQKADRKTTLIALGGGVIGDMTGFAAATFMRGIPFIQIPTTLLAQVDSSVGGKTAVNHPAGKNMIGAFYQPKCVLADIDTLNTLPEREFRAGFSEIVKYGLIRDSEFFSWLENNFESIFDREDHVLIEMIARACQNKADVVIADEHEQGERALLNFGHTFGHAIETHQHYEGYLHGEAVAIGMLMATEFSARLGYLSTSQTERIKHLLQAAQLPLDVPGTLSPASFLELMAHDKKTLNNIIRLILLKDIGHAIISQDYDRAQLQHYLQDRLTPAGS
ncbi:MAG: 3-dehydroquinate synthase [Gammaproteobacteria bacterium]|nr:3-dehydroquinate synthase [Gammaproteobacteria bacterium]